MRSPTLSPLAGAILAGLLLTACGGGNDNDNELSSDNAQGYAADASTIPVEAITGVDDASDALETALTSSRTSGGASAAAVLPAGTSAGSADCAGGGTVAWTVTGGTDAQRDNDQLDPGENYLLTYTACVGRNGGPTLDGTLAILVTARSASGSDLALSATTLTATTARGSLTVDGDMRRVRETVALASGGRRTSVSLTGTGIALARARGSRQAAYTVNALDWTVVRSVAADGSVTRRTHAGTAVIDASTTRRPDATLAITTQGALTLTNDGHVSAGLMTVVTNFNRIEVEHGGGTVTLRLDLGNDGSIDRTWTLTREAFEDASG